MQVTKLIDGKISYQDIPKPTDAEMQNEYDYLLSEQITRKMLSSGLISREEFDKIMAKNRLSFSPMIAKIAAK